MRSTSVLCRAQEWKPVESLDVDLPRGQFKAEWINVLDGSIARKDAFQHSGGNKSLAAPEYQDDIALRIVRED